MISRENLEKNPAPDSDSDSNSEVAPAPPPPAARRKGRRKKGGGGGRKKAKEFMDVADQAFAHQAAMSVWREVEGVIDASPSPKEGAVRLRSLGTFEDRGEFAPIWQKNWEDAWGRTENAATPPERLEIVMSVVVKSFEQENEARLEAGLPLIIDEREGQQFIDFALNRLFEEAGGEIEEEI
ncbi:MAG: hypothetical protein VCE91_17920 [Nitrospinota bacterium]